MKRQNATPVLEHLCCCCAAAWLISRLLYVTVCIWRHSPKPAKWLVADCRRGVQRWTNALQPAFPGLLPQRQSPGGGTTPLSKHTAEAEQSHFGSAPVMRLPLFGMLLLTEKNKSIAAVTQCIQHSLCTFRGHSTLCRIENTYCW